MRTYKIVKVDWVDCVTTQEWRDRQLLRGRGADDCVSCGILVKTQKGTMGLTHSIGGNDVNSTIIIPRKTIKKIETIATFKV